jgi:endonuclease/exonuclease/phosphatase (EEP) superfamily protein YafD
MDILGPVLVTLGSIAVLATIAALVRADVWWIRWFDFPRVQIAVLGAVALAGLLAVRLEPRALDLALTLALVGCLAIQGGRIAPYTRVARPQVQRSDGARARASIRILIANVFQDNRRADQLLALVGRERPDVVLAMETDDWWARQLDALAPDLPHAVACPLDNTYGMVLRTRLPVRAPVIDFLVEGDVPSVHVVLRLESGDEIELHGVHPRPPSPTENDRSTERDAELIVVGRRVKDAERPVIVAGDLNDVAWSRTTRLFQKESGLLDPRVGRGFFATYHADHPLLRWPLDHVFHSRHFRLRELRRLDHIGSDHFPVLIELSLEPDAPAAQEEPPEPDAAERREATEKVEEARER